jgi:hypothetical protein
MLPDNTPKYDPETHLVTLPSVKGIQWVANGANVPSGTLGPLQEDTSIKIQAVAVERVRISGESEWTFSY